MRELTPNPADPEPRWSLSTRNTSRGLLKYRPNRFAFGPPMTNDTKSAPRVFISYAQEDVAHSARVLALSNALRRDGITSELDQYHQQELIDWPRWCREQLRPEYADWVLLICTPIYKARVEDPAGTGVSVGRGVYWEGAAIVNAIYADKGNARFVPLLLDDAPDEAVPGVVEGYTRFRVCDFGLASGDPGYEALYRLLTRQPGVAPPVPGAAVALAPWAELGVPPPGPTSSPRPVAPPPEVQMPPAGAAAPPGSTDAASAMSPAADGVPPSAPERGGPPGRLVWAVAGVSVLGAGLGAFLWLGPERERVPVTDWTPESRPVAATKPVPPVAEVKMAAEHKPVPETSPVAEVKPVPESKPVLETPSVAGVKPTPESKPVPDTLPIPEVKPAPESAPVAVTKGLPKAEPVPPSQPTAASAPSLGSPGDAAMATGHYDHALTAYRAALALDPADEAAQYGAAKAVILADQGPALDEKSAVRKLTALRKQHPSDPHLPIMLGKLTENDADAAALFRAALALDQNQPEAWFELSLRTTSTSAAKKDVERAVQLAPKEPMYLAALGDSLLAEEDFSGALVRYNSALALKPDWLMVQMAAGSAALLAGEIEAAHAHHEQALVGLGQKNAFASPMDAGPWVLNGMAAPVTLETDDAKRAYALMSIALTRWLAGDKTGAKQLAVQGNTLAGAARARSALDADLRQLEEVRPEWGPAVAAWRTGIPRR